MSTSSASSPPGILPHVRTTEAARRAEMVRRRRSRQGSPQCELDPRPEARRQFSGDIDDTLQLADRALAVLVVLRSEVEQMVAGKRSGCGRPARVDGIGTISAMSRSGSR